MSIHATLRTLVTRYGGRVLDEADDLRATLDDFLEEGQASPGDIAVLVDAVRLGAYQQMVSLLRHGADPRAAVEAAGARMAADRGGDQRSASWALAALGYAVDQIPEPIVLSYRDRQTPSRGFPEESAPQQPQPPAGWQDSRTQNIVPPTLHSPERAESAPPPTLVVRPMPARAMQTRGRAVPLIVLFTLVALAAGGTWWLLLPDTGTDEARTSTPTMEEPTGASESPPPDDGPLDVGAPYENQACEGQILLMLASSDDPAKYEERVEYALAKEPGARYLRTDQSCSSFFQQSDTGDAVYAAYTGPFTSIDEACQARQESGIWDAYVRTVASDREDADICSCLQTASQLPRLGMNADDEETTTLEKQSVVELQRLLYRVGKNPDRHLTGYFGSLTDGMVRDFQREHGLVVDGRVGEQTWEGLLALGCPASVQP